MDEKNRFLDAYKEKIVEQQKEPEVEIKEDPHSKETSIAPKEGGALKFEQKSEFKKPEKNKGKSIKGPSSKTQMAIVIAISAVILIGLTIGLVRFLNRGVEVMNFVGWTENDVKLWAGENGIVLQIEKEYNDEVEAGKVISQGVDEGNRIKKGEFMGMVISQGHDMSVSLPLPDLLNMTKDQVESWAKENFMDKVRITAEYNDEIPQGNVISYEINDDTVVGEVKRSTPIYVVVSKGVEAEGALNIVVPNFKEMGIAESYAFANEHGIELIVEEEYDDYVPEGVTISQSIEAEEKVAKDTEITLVISKGKLIEVPNFSGYSQEKAMALAGEKGISVITKERFSGQPAEAFISQSIKAGSEYERGEILELTYSLGNKIVLPSFVGQTRDAIESWAKELNEQGASISIKASHTASNHSKGTIIYQDKGSATIGIKTAINITVSSGKVIFAPDFVAPKGSGYENAITREKALAISEELGIVLIFKEENKSDRLPGEVWHQSVEAGKEIAEGSTMTLKYVPSNLKVTIPDFTGMTEEDIIKGGYNKLLDINIEIGPGDKEGDEGKVYKQSLNVNTKTVAGSKITLTIAFDMGDEIPDGEELSDTENPETNGDLK